MRVKNQDKPLTKDYQYPGKLSWNDLMQTKNLYVVNNTHQKEASTYLYFNKDFIVNFLELDATLQDKFTNLLQDDSINAVAGKSKQGIKYLGKKSNLPTCSLKFATGQYDTSISHQLKINGSDQRIGVITMKPLAEGPQILIATHVIKGGFHNNKHNGKSLVTNELPIESSSLHSKMRFFKPAQCSRDETKVENSNSKKNPNGKGVR